MLYASKWHLQGTFSSSIKILSDSESTGENH